MLSRTGVKAGASGIADQVLLSGTNLAVGLILARALAPASFGVYVIGVAVMLAGSSAQVSLVTDPLMILAPPKSGSAQSRYLAGLLWIQAGISVAVAAATILTGEMLRRAWGNGSEIPAALIAAGAVTMPVQLQSFFRAILFARLRPAAVLWNDLLCCAVRLAAVGLLVRLDMLSVYAVILATGAAASVASIAGIALCRDVLAARAERLRSIWSAHWDYGRWLLATSAAFWCSGQAPAILTSSLLTPVAAAVIKACQYLVAPLNVAFMGLDGVLAPRASQIRATGGDRSLDRFVRIVMIAAGGAALLYALALLPLAQPLLDAIYGGRYGGHTMVVAVLLLDAVISAAARAPILRLKVMGATRTIFHGYLWAAVAGLAALFLLAPRLGVLGAAIAAPVSSAALLSFLGLRSMAGLVEAPPLSVAAGSRVVVPEP